MPPRARRATDSRVRRRCGKCFSSGPTPEAERRSGGSSTAASSASASASTASISAKIRSNVSSSVSEMSDFPSRLMRFDVDSIESMIRPLRLSFARSSSPSRRLPGGDVGDLLDADLDARLQVLLARPDVDTDEAGVGVLRREAVDGVRHAALLADLLEEARRRGAAEDRVEQRRRKAAAVGARDAGRAEAHVVLLGVLALKAEPGRRLRHERPAHARRRGPFAARSRSKRVRSPTGGRA